MIILIGHSAAGKTTIEKELANQGFNRIISYTSRPMRSGEINGYDYHYISEEDFLNKMERGFFAEHTNYRGWHYGISKLDCLDDSIVTVEPVGFRMLKKISGLNIVSFFIMASERTRLIRMAKRGDDIGEIFRRLYSDQGSFNGIESEVDYIVENEDDKLEDAIQKIISIVKNI
jgi:guanylate kinase